MSEEATAVGRVCHVGLGLADVMFETEQCSYSRTVWCHVPGRGLITHVGQIAEVELGGPYGSISRILSVREPEEEGGKP